MRRPPDGIDWRELITFATLAPSGHNTQPWRFRPRGNVLELLADRTRRLPVADPHDRELVISCGAALEMLRIAMRHAWRSARIERFPDPAETDLLARIAPGAPTAPTRRIEAWYVAASRRRTNRRPYDSRRPSDSVLRMLVEVATTEQTRVRPIVAVAEKRAVAGLIAEGDRCQGADAAFRRELAAWLRVNPSRATDGMPCSAFGVPGLLSPVFPRVIRTFDWGARQAAKDHELALQAPVLLVLATKGDTQADWLQAGSALARLLLQATCDGLCASFFSQPLEVPALRQQLASSLDGAGHPQLLLRVGYGPDVPPTPRRTIDEVLVV